ncbi:MAG: 50S ribosomal protein L25 [Candidatus Daviesbacteria bacterium]|nr:50S ribosomal protein L25 [Candidatus Daviesbacteria bacterium]
MDRISLQASERQILGKKVKALRRDGIIPGHVFGKGFETEHVSVNAKDFHQVFVTAGETGLIDLKIGEEKIKPVLVRGVQYDPVSGDLLNIDFYQVNLKEKVKVPVPIVLIGEQPETVKLGETIVLQTLNEVEVEALPTDLVEKIEVDITSLKAVDDAITIGQLIFDREKLTISLPEEEIVVKLAPAVTAEMEALLEEQAAEAAAVVTEEAAEGAEGEVKEGEEETEGGEAPAAEGEAPEAKPEGEEAPKES